MLCGHFVIVILESNHEIHVDHSVMKNGQNAAFAWIQMHTVMVRYCLLLPCQHLIDNYFFIYSIER